MNRTVTACLAAVLAVALASPLAAQEKSSPTSKGKGSKAGHAGKATLVPVDKLDWKDAANMPAGVKEAKLWDEPDGGHAMMMKLPAGASAPLHYHTADHEVTVVSGTLVLTPEGESATKLPPGSAFRFTGKKRHTTACEAGADCVLALEVKGVWDLVMADKK